MTQTLDIRPFVPTDLDAVLTLYPAAFPDEDLLPLVSDLAGCEDAIAFVARMDDRLVGHIAYTRCTLGTPGAQIALLAPLAVHPDFAKQGIGSALAKTGNKVMAESGAAAILVLGDPLYYGRFGFKAEDLIETPHPLPTEWAEAWQSIWLDDNKIDQRQKLVVPALWDKPELWA